MVRRQNSLDMQKRIGEVTWYASTGYELVRVPLRYASILGPADASMIVSGTTCRTIEELNELREAILEACLVVTEHLTGTTP